MRIIFKKEGYLMKRNFFQNLLHRVFQNCAKPEGRIGKWTRVIDGMKLISRDNLVCALKEAGFREVRTDQKSVMGDAGRWLCVRAKK